MRSEATGLDGLTAALALDGAADRPARLRHVDWLATLDLANRHMLGPTILERLTREGHASLLPVDVEQYLRMLHVRVLKRNARIREQAADLIDILAPIGASPVFLKGATTTLGAQGALNHGRLMRDLDVLVRSDDLAAILAALEADGYRLNDAYPEGHHAYGEFVKDGAPAAVDIHIELLDQPYVLPARDVRHRRRPLTIGGVKAAQPDPTDRLLHHLLHAQIHHRGRYYRGGVRLDHLFEFTLLLAADARADDPSIDWQRVRRTLRRWGLDRILSSYLILARDLFALPPAALEHAAPPDRRSRRHARWVLASLRRPALSRVNAPVGNLAAAFAAHRMNALYRDRLPFGLRRAGHAVHVLGNIGLREALSKTFR